MPSLTRIHACPITGQAFLRGTGAACAPPIRLRLSELLLAELVAAQVLMGRRDRSQLLGEMWRGVLALRSAMQTANLIDRGMSTRKKTIAEVAGATGTSIRMATKTITKTTERLSSRQTLSLKSRTLRHAHLHPGHTSHDAEGCKDQARMGCE